MFRQALRIRDRQHDERRVQDPHGRLQCVKRGVRPQIRDSPTPSRDEDAEGDQPELVLLTGWAREDRGRASTRAAQEGVQMHGGIGMTDEYDIGLYMKRDRVLNELFGDPAYHSDRLARMKGY